MPATRIIVLFNLKPGKRMSDYEAWARAHDLPTVNGLGSIRKFEVFKSKSRLIGEGKPTYQYVEIIDVKDMDAFGTDISDATVQRVAGEFAEFADAEFIVTKKIGWKRGKTEAAA